MSEEAGKPVGIAEVARRAGVGLGTASRALNGQAAVRAATREKVLAAARELGYVARPAMAALASMRRQSRGGREGVWVALLTRDPDLGRERVSHWLALLAEPGRAKGYHFEHFDTSEQPDAGVFGRKLHQRGFSAVVLAAIHQGKEWFAEFPWERFVAVSMDAAFDVAPIPVIRESQFETVLRVCERVKAKGYRRLGIVIPDPGSGRVEDFRRMQAARGWLEHQSAECRLPVLRTEGATARLPGDTASWLEKHRPEALVALHGGVAAALRRQACPLPVAVLAGASRDGYSGMSFSNVRPEETVSLVDILIRSASYGLPRRHVHHVIRPNWIDGRSLG